MWAFVIIGGILSLGALISMTKPEKVSKGHTANTEKVSKEYHGIDVSHHQKQIDWEQVKKDKNIEFVYIKATEGATHLDKQYKYNIKSASFCLIYFAKATFLKS